MRSGYIPKIPAPRGFRRDPWFWGGVSAPDGDAGPWISAPVGSVYTQYDEAGGIAGLWAKYEDNKTNYDWGGVGMFALQQTVAFSDFTDGGAAVGTLTMNGDLPAGAFFYRSLVHNLTGFTGNVACTLTIGDGTDVDRYNTGTPSIFTTAVMVDMGAPSGTAAHVAAVSPVLTATSNSDWGAVTAGAMTVRLLYVR